MIGRAFAKLQTPAITPSAARPRERARGTSLPEGGEGIKFTPSVSSSAFAE